MEQIEQKEVLAETVERKDYRLDIQELKLEEADRYYELRRAYLEGRVNYDSLEMSRADKSTVVEKDQESFLWDFSRQFPEDSFSVRLRLGQVFVGYVRQIFKQVT